MIYCETERLILRDWHEDDLLPFQKMNAIMTYVNIFQVY